MAFVPALPYALSLLRGSYVFQRLAVISVYGGNGGISYKLMTNDSQFMTILLHRFMYDGKYQPVYIEYQP